jgi:hypothetical protein
VNCRQKGSGFTLSTANFLPFSTERIKFKTLTYRYGRIKNIDPVTGFDPVPNIRSHLVRQSGDQIRLVILVTGSIRYPVRPDTGSLFNFFFPTY